MFGMYTVNFRRTVTLVIVASLIGMTLGVGAAVAQDDGSEMQEGVATESDTVTEAQTNNGTTEETTVDEVVSEESTEAVQTGQQITESEEEATGAGAADLVDFDDDFATDDPTGELLEDDLLDDDFPSGGLFE